MFFFRVPNDFLSTIFVRQVFLSDCIEFKKEIKFRMLLEFLEMFVQLPEPVVSQ